MGLVIIQEPESGGEGVGRESRMTNSCDELMTSCDECPLAG